MSVNRVWNIEPLAKCERASPGPGSGTSMTPRSRLSAARYEGPTLPIARRPRDRVVEGR
jgi:hypothetical protein